MDKMRLASFLLLNYEWRGQFLDMMLFDQRIVRFGEGILPQWPQHRLSKTVLLMTPHLASQFIWYIPHELISVLVPSPTHHVQVYLKWWNFSSPERIFTFVRVPV